MLSRLKLYQFRNYDSASFEFSPGLNIFSGMNGQGKTNVLEAAYYLSLLRSFRTSKMIHLRQWNGSGFSIVGYQQEADGFSTELSVFYGNERRLQVNGTVIRKASDFIRRLICVSFIPQDLDIIKGSAQNRRRFLDIALSQCDGAYLHFLQQYMVALKSRNTMLKNPEKYPRSTLTAYDYELVRCGVEIELKRMDFVRQLNECMKEQSQLFILDGRKISLKYLSGISSMLQDIQGDRDSLTKLYFETLEKSFERDCRDGNTRFGPHRSELSCLLANNLLMNYGSEGECRLGALALKFSCIDVMSSQLHHHQFTLIVDEVFGELDAQRRAVFFSEIQKRGQVFLACTRIPDELSGPKKVFHIAGGSVTGEEIINF